MGETTTDFSCLRLDSNSWRFDVKAEHSITDSNTLTK